jgi:hypothetical protein
VEAHIAEQEAVVDIHCRDMGKRLLVANTNSLNGASVDWVPVELAKQVVVEEVVVAATLVLVCA